MPLQNPGAEKQPAVSAGPVAPERTTQLQRELVQNVQVLSSNLVTFTTDKTGECFLTNPGDLNVIVSKVCKEITGINHDPEFATDGGTSDARFIKDYCEVLELGLLNRTLHKVDEYVMVKDLYKLHEIYFRILEEYFDKS